MKLSDIIETTTPTKTETKAQASLRQSKELAARLLASKKATAVPIGSAPAINNTSKRGTYQGD